MKELKIVSNASEIVVFNAAVDSIVGESPTNCQDMVATPA